MDLYLIFDKKTNFYFIQNNEPFFYAFTNYREAEVFCNSHPGTRTESQVIESEEDDDYITECLYQRGFKGGYINGRFLAINQSNPELIKFIPEDSGLLNLLLFQGTKKSALIKKQRFYFFVTITEEGYLAFANTNGYIFGFTDIDNMDTKLAKKLYQMGYEVVKYCLDADHKYIINANRNTQCFLENNMVLSETAA